MEDNKYSAPKIAGVLLLAIAAALSTFLSYRAYAISRQLEEASRHSFQALQKEVTLLNTQVASLTSRVAMAAQGRAPSPYLHSGIDNDIPLDTASIQNGPPPQGSAPNKFDRGIAEHGDARGAGNGGSKDVSAYVKNLQEKRSSLIRTDSERYGKELAALYKAVQAGGDPKKSKDGDRAFSQMVQQYPEAYTTAVATGERALQSALNGNTGDVENYYNMLLANQYSSSVITDLGVEALPSIMGYLASQYIQNGRVVEAESLLQGLEGNYDQTLIAVPGPRGEPEWRKVSEVVQGMRQQMTAGAGH